jgi:hypothetical protein
MALRQPRARGPVQGLNGKTRICGQLRGRGRLTILLATLLLAFGCESQLPTPSTDTAAGKQDPRSPRIKKRDALHPEGTSKNLPAAQGRRK